MKITILNDNYAGNGCGAEHGLSYLIEADIRFLFDTGPSDVVVRNAKVLGIDLAEIKTIVLSHGHYDHGGGLPFFNGQQLIGHPNIFAGHYHKIGRRNLGLPLSLSEAKRRFELRFSKEPLWISGQVVFLGQIPRVTDFESKSTVFVDENGVDDFIIDDSGLAIKTEQGLVVVSGCAHSGICNMVDYAVKVTGIEKIYAVLGGFHLKKADKLTAKTIEFLKDRQVSKVCPSHCTDFPAMVEFYKEWSTEPPKCGEIIIL